MTTAQNFTSPVGRLVGGHVFKYNDKDFDGRPLMTRDQKPRVEYIAVVAFPKVDPKTEEMRRVIYETAVAGFPSLFAGGQVPPGFSFKWTDGDSTVPNMRGNKPCDKEGFPGCWVMTFKSSFAPKVYGQSQEPIADEKAIKRGDWVRVGVSCKSNESQSKPGVYLNHSMLQLCGYGEEIASGPDVAVVFAEAYALPAGASATPVAPSGVAPGGVPAPPAGIPAGIPAPPGAAPPAGIPAGIPAPAPVPGFGAAPQAAPAAPVAPAAPIAPAPPMAKQTTPGSPTYASLVTAGWTEDQMRSSGYLV